MPKTSLSKPIKKVKRPKRPVKRAKLPMATRRTIKRRLNKLAAGEKIPMSAWLLEFQHHGLTRQDVYNIKNNRVKLEQKPRADKGQSRMKPEDYAPLDPNTPFDELMDEQVRFTLIDIRGRTQIDPIDRAATLERLTRVKRHILAAKLVGQLKRSDAELFARVIRRFMPEATDEQIVLIYHEERALLEATLREDGQ